SEHGGIRHPAIPSRSILLWLNFDPPATAARSITAARHNAPAMTLGLKGVVKRWNEIYEHGDCQVFEPLLEKALAYCLRTFLDQCEHVGAADAEAHGSSGFRSSF